MKTSQSASCCIVKIKCFGIFFPHAYCAQCALHLIWFRVYWHRHIAHYLLCVHLDQSIAAAVTPHFIWKNNRPANNSFEKIERKKKNATQIQMIRCATVNVGARFLHIIFHAISKNLHFNQKSKCHNQIAWWDSFSPSLNIAFSLNIFNNHESSDMLPSTWQTHDVYCSSS